MSLECELERMSAIRKELLENTHDNDAQASANLETGQHLIGQNIASSKNEKLMKTITAQSMFGASGP